MTVCYILPFSTYQSWQISTKSVAFSPLGALCMTLFRLLLHFCAVLFTHWMTITKKWPRNDLFIELSPAIDFA